MVTNCLSKQWAFACLYGAEYTIKSGYSLPMPSAADVAWNYEFDGSMPTCYKGIELFNNCSNAIRRIAGYFISSRQINIELAYRYFSEKCLFSNNGHVLTNYWFGQRQPVLGVCCVAKEIAETYLRTLEDEDEPSLPYLRFTERWAKPWKADSFEIRRVRHPVFRTNLSTAI